MERLVDPQCSVLGSQAFETSSPELGDTALHKMVHVATGTQGLNLGIQTIFITVLVAGPLSL